MLYQEKPPSRQFIKWTKMNKEKQRLVKPPLERTRRRKRVGFQSHVRLR
jgi:hypothetical protein